jgi:UDP-N-acetylmuramyl pentapeptide phosphotransferase/UDP-N-acetylglucosamine-1-phosphate transferase
MEEIKINWLIISLLISFFSTLFIVRAYQAKKIEAKKYNSVQKIHDGDIPRIGGLSIMLALITTASLNSETLYSDFLIKITISAVPLFFIAFIEDVYHSIKPSIRLLGVSISGILFVYLTGISLDKLQTPGLDFLAQFSLFSFIFTVFAIAAMTNAFNIIDASNGITTFTYIVSLASLFLASYVYQDPFIKYLIISLGILPLGFLIFNFPFGKIFLGDSGAYLLGFLLSCLVITFFDRHSDAPKWLAVLILAYPFFELLFSFFRKTLFRKSPFQPDEAHLHLIVNKLTQSIYNKLNKKRYSKLRANNINTLTLMFFWASPFYFVYIHLIYHIEIFNLLSLYINIYLFFYLFVTNNLRK